MRYHAEVGLSRSNNVHVLTEIRRKIMGHPQYCLSYSLKVVGTDTDRSVTYDFLFVVFQSNHGHFGQKLYLVPAKCNGAS